MSNTNTEPTISYTSNVMSTRLQQMIDEKRHVCLNIKCLKSYAFIYGYLERKEEMFRINSDGVLTFAMFSFEDIDAVGSTNIWLKP